MAPKPSQSPLRKVVQLSIGSPLTHVGKPSFSVTGHTTRKRPSRHSSEPWLRLKPRRSAIDKTILSFRPGPSLLGSNRPSCSRAPWTRGISKHPSSPAKALSVPVARRVKTARGLPRTL
eukprot:scaffold5298_cov67-Phaeocystis_antarctica.AAC.19